MSTKPPRRRTGTTATSWPQGVPATSTRSRGYREEEAKKKKEEEEEEVKKKEEEEANKKKEEEEMTLQQ